MKKHLLFCLLFGAAMVSCTKDSEGGDVDVTDTWVNYRKAETTSSSAQNKIYEYRPAPGQYINEFKESATEALAIADALERWGSERQTYVSLGGFGGYIIVGFDHSIPNAKMLDSSDQEYDFHIKGNPFDNSSEPGIVYVMKDTNGNSQPDDIWYELKGADYDSENTIRDYAITYYKPEDKSSVRWTDNIDGSGMINYLEFHIQRTYYPTWITEDTYTLTGVRLEGKAVENPTTGAWIAGNYGWGYADNFGTDLLNNGMVGFKISNAVDAQGNAANLQFIDFIKVQNGVNQQLGRLGEVSTEVFAFADAHLL